MSTIVERTDLARPIPAGDPVGMLPYAVALDDGDGPFDVIDALALAPFVTGREPFARTAHIDRARVDAPLMPVDGTVTRASDAESGRSRLVVGDGWTLRSVRWQGGSASLTVSATSAELAERILAEAVADAAEPPNDMSVAIGFWHHNGRGVVRNERTIARRPWAELCGNYSAPVAAALDRLMRLTADDVRGRLILLHGEPGTGKTTALRALATEWRDWCQVDCVLDPERLFNNTGYLMEVAMGAEDGGRAEQGRWRLLLLEDCDELIRSEAKAATGQALSRLLNLTDGLLGQGRNVLVAITTNEDLARLHPATVRPGRCLTQIEVGPLTRPEAVAWLGRHEATGAERLGPAGATLAQLYAIRDGDPMSGADTTAPTGLYL